VSVPQLDPVVHAPARLSICAVLAAATDWVEFATVRDAAALGDSALSKHSRALEEAGYLEVRKGAVGRRPRTWFRLTRVGRRALSTHIEALQDIARAARLNTPSHVDPTSRPDGRPAARSGS
jgi:DNA-binding transcriptional ArsR family regulator